VSASPTPQPAPPTVEELDALRARFHAARSVALHAEAELDAAIAQAFAARASSAPAASDEGGFFVSSGDTPDPSPNDTTTTARHP
jgi:hypothetical protein